MTDVVVMQANPYLINDDKQKKNAQINEVSYTECY